MRRVVLESPYSGQVARNVAYAQRAWLDCVERGESPQASHLVGPQILDDNDPKQRATGIAAGHAWIEVADAMVVYEDHGISTGMAQGIAEAGIHGIPIEYRKINI